MEHLPTDLLLELTNFVSVRTLKRLILVCKRFSLIYRNVLFKNPKLRTRLTFKQIHKIPVQILQTRNVLFNEKWPKQLPVSVKRVIINGAWNMHGILPRIIKYAKDVEFYMPVTYLRRSPWRLENYENLDNLQLFTTAKEILWPKLLPLYRNFKFQQIVFSHFEICLYSDAQPKSVSQLVQEINQTSVERLILDVVSPKFNIDFIREISHLKIVYISSDIFDKSLIFPLQLCREMIYLERINFKSGTLLNSSTFNRMSYRYLLCLNSKYYDDIKNLFSEMHEDIWQVQIEFDMVLKYTNEWLKGLVL